MGKWGKDSYTSEKQTKKKVANDRHTREQAHSGWGHRSKKKGIASPLRKARVTWEDIDDLICFRRHLNASLPSGRPQRATRIEKAQAQK